MIRGAPSAILALVGLSLLLGGCAALSGWTPSRVEALALSHRQKAQALERDGALRPALDEWKIALTIDPNDATAQEATKRLPARIETAVADRIRRGREARARGADLEARRHFLAALALDPSNKPAFEALQTETKEARFATHTVGRGETLATIAQRYYGDRARADVIAQANRLPPNPRLAPGTQLRIPEIPRVASPPSEPLGEGPHEARVPPTKEEPEVNPLVRDTREALDRKEYQVVLANVEKLLDGNPRSSELLDLKKAGLYGQGVALFQAKKYDDAYKTLTELVKLDPRYQDGAVMRGEVRVQLIQQHYNEGIRLYREDQLEGAIAQWRTVLEYDPTHDEARRSIEQAERILKALRERQKKP